MIYTSTVNPLELYDGGYNVLTLRPGSKQPSVLWKDYIRKRMVREEIARWQGNFAIITGQLPGGVNIFGVDFDSEELFAEMYPKLPASSMLVKTPNGHHAYYRVAAGIIAPTRAHINDLKLDTRGQGGYMLIPPSTIDGKPYEWLSGPVAPGDLVEFPMELLPEEKPTEAKPIRVTPSDREVTDKARHYLTTAGPAVSGEGGHRKTFRLACKLVHPHPDGFGLTYEEAFALMLWWNPMNRPPWSEKEITHKILDAIKCAK